MPGGSYLFGVLNEAAQSLDLVCSARSVEPRDAFLAQHMGISAPAIFFFSDPFHITIGSVSPPKTADMLPVPRDNFDFALLLALEFLCSFDH
jgi:hypothetical protein